MNRFGLTFHHLGLAVRRPKTAFSLLSGLGYELGERVFDPEQNVNLSLCRHDTMPSVEVIFPGNGNGPIDALVTHHASGIIYHICYTTEDLDLTLAGLKQADLRYICVASRKPAVLFGGQHVSFYMISGVGLVEILETSGTQSAVKNLDIAGTEGQSGLSE
jgi:hypothetical protein